MTRSKNNPTPQNPPPTWDEILIRRLTPCRIEVLGILILFIGTLLLAALLGAVKQGLIYILATYIRQIFGWGSHLVALSTITFGIYLTLRRSENRLKIHPKQIIGIELIILALLPISHQLLNTTMPNAIAGDAGGILGWSISTWLLQYLGPILTNTVYLTLIGIGIILLSHTSWQAVIEWLREISEGLITWGTQLAPVERINVIGTAYIADDDNAPATATASFHRTPQLPAFSLLDHGIPFEPDLKDLAHKKNRILQTLEDFGIPATINDTDIRYGPAVTQFGVVPGVLQKIGADGLMQEQGISVRKIAMLNKDLALALAVPRLRIEAPVPGRGVVGIEVPNTITEVVHLRAVLESAIYQKMKTGLPVALGRDVSGSPIVTDVTKLPHMLIAGTTGSGKSVCLNALIANLIFNNGPDRLRLVLIDPKRVELIRFNSLPHLLGNVEVDPDRIIGVLRWVVAEMDQRYKMFANIGVKHLAGYNERIMQTKGEGELPYITVFVDELADLMAIYPEDIERTLARLAQMARATGIHLIVATQRPSTDVLTGLIKANFPARIAFSVASSIDSRVIVDTVGAENLLGKGDMLFVSADAGSAQRIQGVWVSDDEIDRIAHHWQTVMGDYEAPEAPWEGLLARMNVIEQTDDLLERAVAFAQSNDTISTSLLQRKLRVGYPRAARLMEALYEMGMVEDPKQGGKTRQSLVTDEEGDALETFLDNLGEA
jgi:S-DNA-T family DNA segregation ATPase FtsK/SpoIIIE